MFQHSLFPDAFEAHERALHALDRLDFDAAWTRIEEARARDPGLAELATTRDCIAWLRTALGSAECSAEALAASFRRVPAELAAGRIARATAARIDEVLARRGLERARPGDAFLDRAELVPLGALLLVLGRAAEALGLLRESLAGGRDARADLWGHYADACARTERVDEANAAMVRALLLGAGEVDLERLADARLSVLLDELRQSRPEPEARARLLAHAWLAGVLAIPAANGWLDPHLSRLHLASPPCPDGSPEERQRRFALLLFVDRSRPHGACEPGERAEMQALDPELFALVIRRIDALDPSRLRTSSR